MFFRALGPPPSYATVKGSPISATFYHFSAIFDHFLATFFWLKWALKFSKMEVFFN